MSKRFNVTGICIPEKNYMVDVGYKIDSIITGYIEEGKYFTINCARQYGKSTTLYLLEQRLKPQYTVIQLSFEAADELFVSLYALAAGLQRKISRILKMQQISPSLLKDWDRTLSEQFPLDDLGEHITELCRNSKKKVVLIIDEVDKSSDNQIFLSFLGLLRSKYLEQLKKKDCTFESVILAGVYDIKNLKLKIHPEQELKYNSPWNIAADFKINMNFMPDDIAGMLREYEKDYHTGMDIDAVSRLIFDYTSGYPYLVSRICQLADEDLSGTKRFPQKKDVWTLEGIVAAEALLRRSSNTLFDDLIKKLTDYPKLKKIIQDILFCGNTYSFEIENPLINLGVTFGFIKDKDGIVIIGNRIFETKLYDLFLAEMAVDERIVIEDKEIIEAIV